MPAPWLSSRALSSNCVSGSFFSLVVIVLLHESNRCRSPIVLSLTYRLSGATSAVENAKHRRHENKRSNCGTQQTTDDRASKRRVLLSTFPQSKRYGNHADNHGEGGHEYGAKARETRLDGRLHSIGMFGKPLFSERHDEDAVGSRDPHAHDRSHQSRYAERGMSEKQEDDDPRERRRQRRDDNKRIEPGLEIYHDQEVDEHDGKAKAGQ